MKPDDVADRAEEAESIMLKIENLLYELNPPIGVAVAALCALLVNHLSATCTNKSQIIMILDKITIMTHLLVDQLEDLQKDENERSK